MYQKVFGASLVNGREYKRHDFTDSEAEKISSQVRHILKEGPGLKQPSFNLEFDGRDVVRQYKL